MTRYNQLKNSTKENRTLLSELPYHNVNNLVDIHGQFNNLLENSLLPTKRYLNKLHSLNDLDIFASNIKQNDDMNPDFQYHNQVSANYYSPYSFNELKKKSENSSFLILHNVRSLQLHLDELQTHLLEELNYRFHIIGVSETKINATSSTQTTLNLNIPGYNFEHVPTPLLFGGVGMYISDQLKYSVIEKISNETFQAMWIEIHFEKNIYNLWYYL